MPLDRFRAAVGVPPQDSRWLIGLSGGSDSVALLSLAKTWRDRERPDVSIAVAHLDHQLRGEESKRDAEFCAELASRLDLPFHLAEEDVAARATRTQISIETAGRVARLALFARLAEAEGFDTVLTAHHRDDQVETILARVLRGSGTRGWSGIARRRSLAPDLSITLLRPCLAIERVELTRWRESKGLPHREDETNRALVAERNRLRHRLLPALRRRLNPRIDAQLLQLAAGAARIERARRGFVERWGERILRHRAHYALPPPVCLALSEDPGGAVAVLQAIWDGAIGASLCANPPVNSRPDRSYAGELRRGHHRAWLEFLGGDGRGTSIDLPGPVTVERCGGWVHLIGGAQRPGGTPKTIVLDRPRGHEWRGATIQVGIVAPDPLAPSEDSPLSPLRASLPTDRPLVLRGARPEDRIIDRGLGHRVSEWLRTAGIPARWRPEYPVIAIADRAGERHRVLWVPGVRPPSCAAPTATETAQITVLPDPGNDAIAFFLQLREKHGRDVKAPIR